MNRISVVLFDLGNVLASIDFDAFWCSLGLKELELRIPYANQYKRLTREYETGLMSTNQYLQRLYSLFEEKYSVHDLKQAVESIIREPLDGMAEIVKAVSDRYQTGLVSNTNELHYTLSYARCESLHFLHKQFLSYRLRVMKPDMGFYHAVLNDYKVAPSEILFTDDLEENLVCAKNARMQTVLFRNMQQFRKELIRLKVI
jgi:glucose-1-phosphatase